MLPVSHLTQQTSQVNQPVPTSPLATWLQAWNSASATSQAALAASSRFGRAWKICSGLGVQIPRVVS